MKITIDSIKKAALIVGGIFFSSLSIIKADGNTQSGLRPEMLRPDFSTLTPEAASLGRYGAFQVSEYSGTANISIPLYTVKSGDVSFPINLYYDATGIKVEQYATFVGLGWNLSYGGMISHIVCGEDDFLDFREWSEYACNWWSNKKEEIKPQIYNDAPFHIEQTLKEMMYKKYPYGFPKPKSKEDYSAFLSSIIRGYDSDQNKELYLYDKMANGYDVPDVFQANFCGHSISFVIDKRAGKAPNTKVYPITILNNNPRKYKISYNPDGYYVNGYPTSFVITDDKGITYCFNNAYNENPRPNESRGFDSYYLTKIYGPDGEDGKSFVRFDYSDYSKKNFFHCGKNHEPTTRVLKENSEQKVSDLYSHYILPNVYSTEIAHCSKIYPSKITTRLETIEFNTTDRSDVPGAKCISEITVKQNSGSSTRKIKFHYGNFSETPAKEYDKGSYSHRRLKLTGVTIDDQNYNFEYDGQNLPSLASYSKDYWGYYNGANPNDNKFVGCTPAYTISNGIVNHVECLTGSNRLASEKLCNVGMLKKVIYPTGGYTLYDFEANRFNDRYYYPDASDKIASVSSYKANDGSLKAFYDQISINGYYNKKGSLTIIAYPTKYYIEIGGSLQDATDTLFCTIKKKNSNVPIIAPIIYTGNKYIGNFGETVSLTLNKDSIYILETKLVTKANGSPSCADIKVRYDAVNTPITTSTTIEDKNGGYSIGGGLRIRTIKNYDSDGTYLNGVKYEYSGGKLLSPTVQLETHYIDCKYLQTGTPYSMWESEGIHFSFLYANTEPSYYYICSLGIPATVGYDRVVKREIDESEKVTYRKTILDFHNYGYDSSSTAYQINSIMQNAFYYPPTAQHNLTNGLIKNDSIFDDSVLVSTTHYDYKGTRLDTIYYQKCLPLHLPIEGTIEDYYLAFFRKCNTWSFLTSKTEKLYNRFGEQTMSNTTQYEYNSSNYQLSQQTVSNGVDSVRTNYWYPTDKKVLTDKEVVGYEFLNEIHNISEVTAIDTYRNGTFTGGSKYRYVKKYSNASKKYFPVVYRCFSVLPNTSKSNVIEMTVTSYDGYGNIREYQKKDGTPVTVIWSYNHQFPVMEIVGKTYSQVKDIYPSVVDLEEKDTTATKIAESTEALHNALLKKEVMATAYEYSPWHTVKRIIKPNGYVVDYGYDSYGRLKETKDASGILQKYSYKYKNK